MDKYSAAASLHNAAYSPKRLLAIHSGAAVVLSLVLSVISFVLNYAISPSGGLGSMDLQAALSTAQVMLRLVQVVLTPFWTAGLCYAAIGIARGITARPSDLLEGFRRFKPLLTSGILIGLQYAARALISTYISSQLLAFTPLSMKIYDATLALQKDPELDPRTLLGEAYVPVMVTFVCIFAVVFLAVCAPVFYRYRMTRYLIMDAQETGGIRAMMRSRMVMHRRRWELAKLDFSFWWYYALIALGLALCYGDLILSALGVTLPIPDGTAYWLFLCLGLLTQLAVKTLAGPQVAVCYAHRYLRYLTEEPPIPKPRQTPSQNVPWTY